MNRYEEELAAASQRGFLITDSGTRWLDCEVVWRRRCAARRHPSVIVNAHGKRADVSLSLMHMSHSDIADEDLARMLVEFGGPDPSSSKVNILRGRRGRPNLFMGISVSDIPMEEAMELARVLLRLGEELVHKKKPRSSTGA